MKIDLDILFSEEFRRTVEANLGRDPLRVALDRGVPHASAVASQVKYLARARSKLPSWYAARCIVPPLAFEQSSSEAVATATANSIFARKVTQTGMGGVAIDLTCGLGVDAFCLSRRFERVTALERDPFLAAVARENFRRLGADNIEVVNTPAEEFLAGDIRADFIYADPDRRDGGGKKMVRMEDCSPDIAGLLPRIGRLAPRLAVKLSPLFDVDEVFRIFGPHARAEVVSLAGECKEIIAEVSFDSLSAPTVRAVAIGLGEAEYLLPSVLTDGQHDESTLSGASARQFAPERYRYLIVPDVALQKGRLARRYFTERGVWIESNNGYGFAPEKPEGIMGRAIEIESIEPFDPKALKRRLKARGIKNIDILRRDFPLSTADIARGLGIREGGSTAIAFTRASGKLWQIILKTIPAQ
jgi:hypothetical protein